MEYILDIVSMLNSLGMLIILWLCVKCSLLCKWHSKKEMRICVCWYIHISTHTYISFTYICKIYVCGSCVCVCESEKSKYNKRLIGDSG